jgi:hypothetical protein
MKNLSREGKRTMSESFDDVEPLAEAMREQVLDEIGKRIAPLVAASWEELRPRVRRLDASLQEANAWRAEDPSGALLLKAACTLLALYRTLSPCLEEKQELLDALKAVIDKMNFQGGMDLFLLDHFGITPDDTSEDAWNHLCSNFIPKGRERFGRAWVVEQGIKDERRCFFNFRKCGFADFFLENNARDLLYLLCATDYIWGDALEKYGIRFERPTALSEGADACRFQLFRMKEGKREF